MNVDEFDATVQAFCGRRPFRTFQIEFTSGAQMLVKQPEAIRQRGLFYVLRSPDHGFTLFVPESVTRLLDLPNSTSN